ncbi:hypothetical protein SAMN05421835_105177 [Amycolatopsis sacchari]|uniref:Uncharacterized protein n=1 Tax=Amycolatopsis sacchari TaxID=115433 RepID=A0A1I3R8X7_9PSEU|nr:hypothetical protein SAMN05421835_105177 [Amycolatopsis sacchari]
MVGGAGEAAAGVERDRGGVTGAGFAGAEVVLAERVWQRWRAGRWQVPPGRHEVLVGRPAGEAAEVEVV